MDAVRVTLVPVFGVVELALRLTVGVVTGALQTILMALLVARTEPPVAALHIWTRNCLVPAVVYP